MYEIKHDHAFCLRFSKKVEISYLHIIEKDNRINDPSAGAEAKINHICQEKAWCSESNCIQNNIFGTQFMRLL